jgi:hypothetical protein
MKEIRGNLFDQIGIADIICITTNGFVKNNGRAVMGRGCAAEALKRWPEIDWLLGDLLTRHGNFPYDLGEDHLTHIWSFPVKFHSGHCSDDKSNVVSHMRRQFNPGDFVPGWALVASMQQIEESALSMVTVADVEEYEKIVIPRPGCGAGELKWEEVKPELENLLDDRFYIITF